MEVINAIGRRKSSVARVYVTEGTGKITINKKDLEVYFPSAILQYVVKQPLNLLEVAEKYDIKANLDGGGFTGQSQALRLAIARALVKINEEDKNSNIAIADDVTRSDVVEFVPVELKNNTDFRAKLNVVDNPGNIGMGVMLCGKIEKYFGTTGIKSLVEAEIGGETITGIQNLTIGNDADAPIYNLKGERVDQNYRGVVIQNGHKKVQK